MCEKTYFEYFYILEALFIEVQYLNQLGTEQTEYGISIQ